MEEYKQESTIIQLKCDHIFHKYCIAHWLTKPMSTVLELGKKCPCCNQIVQYK